LTYHKSGILGFYPGCGALAVSNALKSGIRFVSFEASRDYLDRVLGTKQGQRSPWVNVLAGLNAGLVESLLVVTPGETLKTIMIEDAASKGSQRFAEKGVVAAATFMIRKKGVGGLWRGALPVLSKQTTNSAVRFTSFGMMHEQVAKRWPILEGKVVTTLVIGALSGIVTV
jgi:solute carrier family 25 (mitochondrial citrate transporter), member 1